MSGLAEEELDTPAWQVWARRAGAVLVVLAVFAGIAVLLRGMMEPAATPRRQMARISIVPDTPPPPPPPPKEEKPPEPPKEQAKQVNVEQPKQAPKPAPDPAQALKMEGEGSDTGLAGVGAGTVTNEYAGQTIGGAGGDRFAGFANSLQQRIQHALEGAERLEGQQYQVLLKIWFQPDGRLRAEIARGTGSETLDAKIVQLIAEMPAVGPLPADLPQPARVRLVSRS